MMRLRAIIDRVAEAHEDGNEKYLYGYVTADDTLYLIGIAKAALEVAEKDFGDSNYALNDLRDAIQPEWRPT